MLELSLAAATPRRILVIGCHSDDIEIGCGGLLLTLAATRPEIAVTWVVLAAEGEREQEARRSAAVFLDGFVTSEVITRPFRDSFLPYVGAPVKEFFEELKQVQ